MDARTFLHVGKSDWPYQRFNAYLRDLMIARDIPDYAELSRLTGISQSQFSYWRAGRSQPTIPLLDQLADTLGIKALSLYVLAGRIDEERVDHSPEPVLPVELLELHGHWAHADEAGRAQLRRYVDMINKAYVGWLQSRPKTTRRAS